MVFLAKLEPEGSEFRRTVRVCVSDVVDPKFLYLSSSLLDHESEKTAVKQRTVVLQFDYDVGPVVGMLVDATNKTGVSFLASNGEQRSLRCHDESTTSEGFGVDG